MTAEREKEIGETEIRWGDPDLAIGLAPSREADQPYRSWLSRYARLSATPKDAVSLMRMNTDIDTRSILPAISVPTLCLYRTRDRDVKVEEGRWICSQIPDCRMVEIDSADHFLGTERSEEMLDAIEEFLTGEKPAPPSTRVLTTVMFIDIVGSTDRAEAIGDTAWRELLDRHYEIVRSAVRHYRGAEVSSAGDGLLATFDGPARAVRTAMNIAERVTSLGLQIRAGIHTGEVELVGADIAGISVQRGGSHREPESAWRSARLPHSQGSGCGKWARVRGSREP